MRVLRGAEMKFVEAVRAYEVARCAVATRETVDSPLVRRLARETRRLSQALRDSDEDNLWMAVMRRLRRTLRELGTTPLAPGSAEFGLASTVSYLNALLDQAKGSYPEEVVARAALCVAALVDLS